MRNYTNNDLLSRMTIFEELSIDFFREDPKNSWNLEILSVWDKYNALLFPLIDMAFSLHYIFLGTVSEEPEVVWICKKRKEIIH